MAEGGLEGSDYLKFVAEGSGNVANDGMFSIQVCFSLQADYNAPSGWCPYIPINEFSA